MQLALQQLIPHPLREKVASAGSGIWGRDMVFEKGEFIFVQAPSGTGKTTLIHILYGLRSDYDGEALWGGQSARRATGEAWANRRSNAISVIFQDMRLAPALTLWENLQLKRSLTDTITEQQMTGWLEGLGLADKKNSPALTLSYGEQQRASIIRALLQPFEWLLMDEPFSHLDHANAQKAIALINEAVKQHHAGVLLADLDANDHFAYTKTLML